MLRSTDSILGYSLSATDGEIGRVLDLLFDDEEWTVRHLLADTGTWLPGRQVLIPPAVLIGPVRWESQTLGVGLTRKAIEKSPSIEADRPVSRGQERSLVSHYGLTYWGAPDAAVPAAAGEAMTGSATTTAAAKTTPDAAPHLHGVKDVTGYAIEAKDGGIGHVEDFIVDCNDWSIRYLVIDTRNWLPGRKVLVSTPWISGLKTHNRVVHVNLVRDQVRESPEYDPSHPVNHEYESRLRDFYGRPQ